MLDSVQIVEYLGSIIECIISLYFMISFFDYKQIRSKYFLSVIALILLVIDNIYLSQKPGFEMISVILLILILFMFSLVALKGRVYLKIVLSLVVPMIIMVINMASLFVISTIADVEIMHLYDVNHEARFLIMFVSKFLYFFATRKGIEILKVKERQLGNIEWLLIVILYLISFAIMMIFWKESITRALSPRLYLSILICLSILNIIVYWMMKRINRLHAEKTELALNAVVYEARSENIETIKKQYKEIRGIKHDMKNYMLSISMLLQQEKIEDAKELLKSITDTSIENMKLQVMTKNEVVDAILNSKFNVCHEKDIKIDYTIEEDCVQIDNKDASILLANLLDNAIEAEEGLNEKRMIKYTMNRYKKYLRIVIENRIEESVLESNPKLKTTKNNKKNHGFGVRTVRKIVEKYNGMMNLSEENGLFKVEILLMQ
jgi:signal transduction histidine kinase